MTQKWLIFDPLRKPRDVWHPTKQMKFFDLNTRNPILDPLETPWDPHFLGFFDISVILKYS